MKKWIIIFLLALVSPATKAQDPPFYSDIRAFKKEDSLHFPPKQAILFIGSSSFTKWRDVQDYFPGYTIINRGFGGSNLKDQIRYVNDIVFPYDPREVVIYCGDNDLAEGADSKEVAERFKTLFQLIRSKLPAARIVYVSIKPSPSRKQLMQLVQQSNQIIKNFLWQQSNVVYANVFDPMLDENGAPRPEIFLNDSLHMNARGYAIWQKVIAPYLVKP